MRYYYDRDTGLYYCKTRYYNPEWGRWLSPDDIEYLDPHSINGLNLYAYCFNDPINYVDYDGHFPVAVKAVTTLIKGAMSLHKIGLQLSLKFFENAPKITMEVAKKMARKGGHIQSARSIMRHQQNLINSTRNSIDDIVKAQKTLGKVLLVADILWNVGENYFSGDPNWVSDSIVDAGISVGIYALGCIPYVGWALALGATAATAIFDDEIEEFKDWFAEGWNNFWSFSWI